MLKRRSLLKLTMALGLMPAARGHAAHVWRAPGEEDPHAATWMCWPHNASIYGEQQRFEEIQLHLGRLAKAISEFEPVYMAAHQADHSSVKALCGERVQPVAIPTNDMWMRDSGPVFVTNKAGDLAAVDFNFNGWGAKQEPRADDGLIASRVAQHLKIPRIATPLVGEGGGIEFDGEGTLLLTDSCWLNDNRNPGISKTEMTEELKRLLGIQKVIWLPGVAGRDITDGHIDGAVRFVRPGLIMTGGFPGDDSIWGEALEESRKILASETDARGRPFTLVDIPSATEPRNTDESLFTSYANYYVANGAVFTPRFHDKRADAVAMEGLAKLYPGRKIVALEVDRIYESGGGIHCVTQQQPATNTT
ncbi:MAG: agmatine deiminase family protein [Pseudomonadota bacterium]